VEWTDRDLLRVGIDAHVARLARADDEIPEWLAPGVQDRVAHPSGGREDDVLTSADPVTATSDAEDPLPFQNPEMLLLVGVPMERAVPSARGDLFQVDTDSLAAAELAQLTEDSAEFLAGGPFEPGDLFDAKELAGDPSAALPCRAASS